MDYVRDRKRCLKEGKAVANTQYLLACGIVEKDESKVVLILMTGQLCAQSAYLMEKPYDIHFHMTGDSFLIVFL